MNTKSVSLVAATMLVAGSLSASEVGMSSLMLGVSKADYSAKESGDSKPYIGVDLMTSLAKSESFHFGVGFDLVGIDGISSSSSTYGNYTLGGGLKVGYSLASLINWNVNLKADLGYGVTRWESSNYWGLQYSASLDAEIYKGWGIGYKYKHVEADVDKNSFDSYSANIFFIQKMF